MNPSRRRRGSLWIDVDGRPVHKLPKSFSEVAKINPKSCRKVANFSEKLPKIANISKKLPKISSQFNKKKLTKVLQIAQKLNIYLNDGLCVMF